ncbi:MAG: aspartate aminotransferase family protein [Alphaproteobacteria bacterium]|nr:aspartate aminotransferase family protein [Alphaproteobacteria bacterium]
MTNILHRHSHVVPRVAARGEGPYVYDVDGAKYLDASGGAAVSCLGHSHPDIIRAIKDQVDVLSYAHTSFFANRPAEDLADLLIEKAPDSLGKVYFVSGGSEAVEAALKMARQYFVEIGEPQRRRVIARWQSYHGNTLGALATGGNLGRREMFLPILGDFASHISPCFEYRYRTTVESSEDYGLRVADELKAEIERLGPDTVAAFIAEPVVGATAGVVPSVPGYFKRIREICDEYGVLLILDEVMCGMGRTGTLFAFEQDGVVPDLVTCAKGLGAGYQPIGAVLLDQRFADAFYHGSGFFHHGHTYMAHATACAAALAVQRVIDRDDLLSNVRLQGDALVDALTARLGNHHHVGDIRGRGLFRGVELVADRATKQPFDPALKLHARVKREAMDRGLMCYPAGGTVDGTSGDHILLAPPFIIDRTHVDEIAEKLGDSIDAAIASAGS